jgi:DNA-binding NarL/FixJ family response regulator
VSGPAVEKHINSIFAKLGLSDGRVANRRVQAVLVHLQSLQRGV